ncbi:GNAT family N-acetyltransferase [Megalodesulfovibrio gigas]|uniref:N-acetyltransferase domain-containing protein n=1 Tax=Megalodesulfovibrio gigas (strain ATCC 19364 / DSM 1382 / NCIMB 9332 / VKM B-1759) TaxID=1121448 RepID=T2GB48_MEGG1|nr:GNAT family N-acetyltransferase [Megalodesulfovibrio gigas]AGW13356.1 hypothetical protein DGI_1515 [Megalodesulfovibrio gigas DSM 1382 = ATCC 19364]
MFSAPSPLRPATLADAAFLATATLGASRSHLPAGYFDLFFPGDDAFRLALLEQAQHTTHRGWGHWSDYHILSPAGAICACPAAALPAFPFPVAALHEAATRLGWTAAEVQAAQARIDDYLYNIDDLEMAGDARTWFVQFLYVAPQWRQRGIARRLMTHTLREAREAGMRRVELFTDTGNAPAEQLYASLGFACIGEYRYQRLPPEQVALLGPGMRRWMLSL